MIHPETVEQSNATGTINRTKKKDPIGDLVKSILPHNLSEMEGGWWMVFFMLITCTSAAFATSFYFNFTNCSTVITAKYDSSCDQFYNPVNLLNSLPPDLLPYMGKSGQASQLNSTANLYFTSASAWSNGTFTRDDINFDLIDDFTDSSADLIPIRYPNFNFIASVKNTSTNSKYLTIEVNFGMQFFGRVCGTQLCNDTSIAITFNMKSTAHPQCDGEVHFGMIDCDRSDLAACYSQFWDISTSFSYLIVWDECGNYDMLDSFTFFSTMLYFTIPSKSPFYECPQCPSFLTAFGSSIGIANTVFATVGLAASWVVSHHLKKHLGLKLKELADVKNAIRVEQLKARANALGLQSDIA